MTKVIAIVNQKGGVAKTTTAINVGAGLAKHNKRVLLIDLDGQGNLSRGLGCKAKARNQFTIRDALINIQKGILTNPTKGILTARYEKISVMPANKQLDAFEHSLKGDLDAPFYLRRYVNTLRQYFDVILIDCSPSLGLMTLNALVAANSVMIPVDPEFFGVEGVEQIVAAMTDVQRKMNPSLSLEGIVIVRRNDISIAKRTNAKNLRLRYGSKVFQTELPTSVKASEASARGMSLLEYMSWNHLARAYASLVEEVLANGRN